MVEEVQTVMLIQQIMEKDTDNCYKAFAEDEQLNEAENIFDVRFDMEQIVNRYMARVTRIAFLQGIKNYAEFFIVLKNDANEILQEYVDI